MYNEFSFAELETVYVCIHAYMKIFFMNHLRWSCKVDDYYSDTQDNSTRLNFSVHVPFQVNCKTAKPGELWEF